MPHNLFFGYEQGRDFIKLAEILSGDLPLVGPKTDFDGVFHGVLSYLVMIPGFVIGGGNPWIVLLSFIVTNALGVIFLYKSVN